MDQPAPLVRDNVEQHQFEIDLGDGEVAFAAYQLRPGTIRFYHTVVPESHRGQGLGTALVKAGLAAARDRGLKVIPTCSFFLEYLRAHRDDQDIVDPAHLRLMRT